MKKISKDLLYSIGHVENLGLTPENIDTILSGYTSDGMKIDSIIRLIKVKESIEFLWTAIEDNNFRVTKGLFSNLMSILSDEMFINSEIQMNIYILINKFSNAENDVKGISDLFNKIIETNLLGKNSFVIAYLLANAIVFEKYKEIIAIRDVKDFEIILFNKTNIN